MKEPTDSKERILQAARGLFARDGFDGTRVDEIARTAGVNKALIYYYFKSKEELLEELFTRLADSYNKNQSETFREAMKEKRDPGPDLFQASMKLLLDNRELFRIAFMEEIKGADVRNLILKTWSVIFDQNVAEFNPGLKPSEVSGAQKARDFFFGFMPSAGYILFHDKLAKILGTDQEKLHKMFLSNSLRMMQFMSEGWEQ
jgi:TetR/AcrR family transcriptional regulator